MGEISGRYGGDIGEIWGRHREIWGRAAVSPPGASAEGRVTAHPNLNANPNPNPNPNPYPNRFTWCFFRMSGDGVGISPHLPISPNISLCLPIPQGYLVLLQKVGGRRGHLPISPYISQYLPTSPYISGLPGASSEGRGTAWVAAVAARPQ